MQSHSTGCLKGNRRGANLVKHSWILPLGRLVSGTDTLLCTIPADTFTPACFAVRVVIGTANNAGTSAVVRVGTSSGATDLINDVDLKAAAKTNYTSNSGGFVYVKADQPLYIRYTEVGTAATAGECVVIVEPFAISMVGINTLEA